MESSLSSCVLQAYLNNFNDSIFNVHVCGAQLLGLAKFILLPQSPPVAGNGLEVFLRVVI